MGGAEPAGIEAQHHTLVVQCETHPLAPVGVDDCDLDQPPAVARVAPHRRELDRSADPIRHLHLGASHLELDAAVDVRVVRRVQVAQHAPHRRLGHLELADAVDDCQAEPLDLRSGDDVSKESTELQPAARRRRAEGGGRRGVRRPLHDAMGGHLHLPRRFVLGQLELHQDDASREQRAAQEQAEAHQLACASSFAVVQHLVASDDDFVRAVELSIEGGADAEHLARDGEDEGLPRQWSQSGGQSHRRAI